MDSLFRGYDEKGLTRMNDLSNNENRLPFEVYEFLHKRVDLPSFCFYLKTHFRERYLYDNLATTRKDLCLSLMEMATQFEEVYEFAFHLACYWLITQRGSLGTLRDEIPGIVEVLQELHGPTQKEEQDIPLTERETEVLRLIAQGHGNQEIAEFLVLSERTVHSHVSRILAKLHLANRTHAALYALRKGIVSLDPD